MSIPEVAAKYRIHRTTALEHLERAGVPRRATPPSLTTDQIEEARGRRANGESYAAIAGFFEVHPETVRRAVARSERG